MNADDYWMEITPEMEAKFRAGGLFPNLKAGMRVSRLHFNIGMPKSLDYKIAHGQAEPSDYYDFQKRRLARLPVQRLAPRFACRPHLKKYCSN